MLVPVVARLQDFQLDGLLDDLKGLDSLVGGRVRRVEVDLFVGCYTRGYLWVNIHGTLGKLTHDSRDAHK